MYHYHSTVKTRAGGRDICRSICSGNQWTKRNIWTRRCGCTQCQPLACKRQYFRRRLSVGRRGSSRNAARLVIEKMKSDDTDVSILSYIRANAACPRQSGRHIVENKDRHRDGIFQYWLWCFWQPSFDGIFPTAHGIVHHHRICISSTVSYSNKMVVGGPGNATRSSHRVRWANNDDDDTFRAVAEHSYNYDERTAMTDDYTQQHHQQQMNR